ncbi:RING-H2 finger protein ATL63-like [Benincasa hispida]|uniref:RING-H2 finger protein ATL63-like n=1 Tax=Benincasa hispida TaxID=102211 RepID=UPI00190110D0|nr:RING-H2 finger protein ATL63-like [Benincasa hispida]
MLAALISLLLVTLFVVLLHIYAKWFLTQARHQRRSSIAVSQVLGQPRLHHFHSISFDHTTPPTRSPTKGLDALVISAIPLFIYVSEKECKIGLECVICLSLFEENEIGRSLPKCKHVFHVECIDMWLSSHSNCPICRVPVVRHQNSRNGIGNNLELTENELQIVIGG